VVDLFAQIKLPYPRFSTLRIIIKGDFRQHLDQASKLPDFLMIHTALMARASRASYQKPPVATSLFLYGALN
jgi:hypothetical protein